jgi:hypothetical protein
MKGLSRQPSHFERHEGRKSLEGLVLTEQNYLPMPSSSLVNPPSYSDEAWKEALTLYFQPFMEFFYAKIAQQIDWRVKYPILDKEFPKRQRDDVAGKRLVDMLIKVQLKDGKNCHILIHCEVQGTRDPEFPRRLFRYYARIDSRQIYLA